MAAYAAVISLKHTINGLLNSSRVSLIPSTRESLEVAYNEATSLQQVLERLSERIRSNSSHEMLDELEGQIRDFAHKLEDVLEFHEYYLYSEEEVVRQEISSFGEAVKKMEKDYTKELSRDDDDDDESRIDDFGVEMVGHSTLFNKILEDLVGIVRPDDNAIFSCLGEHGSGRSVAARTFFEDEREGRTQFFDCWAWVTLGSKPQVKEVLMSIISQVRNPDYELVISIEDEDEEKLGDYLYNLLEERRYMIVLDNVDDVELVDNLLSSLPDESNGSILFLITNSKEVAQMADGFRLKWKISPIFFEAHTWHRMRRLLLGFESEIPEEMEVAGKKIIHNCQCQLLTFYKTILFLFKSDKTVEEWNRIAADKQHPTFMFADELSEVNQIRMELQHCSKRFAKR